MSVIEVPVDESGELLHDPGPATRSRARRWRANDAFSCVLTLVGPLRGTAGRCVQWRSAEGRHFPMFLTDLVELLHATDVIGGTVAGRWIVRKRGQRYGIALLAAEEPRPADLPDYR